METGFDPKRTASFCVEALKRLYPGAVCSLEASGDPFRLLVCVRLSAQCTDERVNMTVPPLFDRYPAIEDFAAAELPELESFIYSCGFYRSKARDIKAAARYIIDTHGGRLPKTMEEMLKIPGIGRKSANLLLGDVYGLPAVVADTHCIRISNRLGLCESRDPAKVEARLRELLLPEESNDFCHRLVLFGRDICPARAPSCGVCPLADICKEGSVRSADQG